MYMCTYLVGGERGTPVASNELEYRMRHTREEYTRVYGEYTIHNEP